MRLCVLGSGSSGNCTYVSSGGTSLLVDAGLSGKETLKRIESAGLSPADVKAILLTHEHSDHIGSLPVLWKKLGAAVFANTGTIQGAEKCLGTPGIQWRVFATGSPFELGDILVEPFSVCHDGLDPVGFVFTSGGVRVCVVTDIGMATTVVREKLKRSHAIVLESNHDERMLRDAHRPWSLKQRISGRQGHLANKHAAELVAECAGPELNAVFLAHLSHDCNRTELALKSVRDALSAKSLRNVTVALTYAEKPSEVWDSEKASGGPAIGL